VRERVQEDFGHDDRQIRRHGFQARQVDARRGQKMKGNTTRRGKNSWRIKFDIEGAPGKRETRFVTVRGTKREAQVEAAKLIAAASKGEYVEPSKVAVADFVRARVDQWEAAGDI